MPNRVDVMIRLCQHHGALVISEAWCTSYDIAGDVEGITQVPLDRGPNDRHALEVAGLLAEYLSHALP